MYSFHKVLHISMTTALYFSAMCQWFGFPSLNVLDGANLFERQMPAL